MKILAVSDQVEERLYSPSVKTLCKDVDLLIGCGDLPFEYLEYLLNVVNVPMVYVPGNHDPVHKSNDPQSQVEGGVNLDLKAIFIKGLFIAGMGGSIRYRDDGVNQYGQTDMYFRALKLIFPLLWYRVRLNRRVDLFITHSPPEGIHDDNDFAHQGLAAINTIMKLFKPRYILHGHTYFYRRNLVAPRTQVNGTTVINVFPYHFIDL